MSKTISEKLVEIAENEQKVYDAGYAEGLKNGGGGTGDGDGSYDEGYENGKTDGIEIGKQAESEAFWNGFTDNGKRTNYLRAFNSWGNEYIRPTRKIIPTNNDAANQMFAFCNNLKKVEADCFDLSQKEIGTTDANSYYYTFSRCPELEEVEDIGFRIAEFNYNNTFAQCGKLHTIAKARCNAGTKFTNSFTGCTALKNISFDDESVIGQTINFAYCGELSAESIRNIFEHLSDEASGKTLHLRAEAINKAVWDDVVSITGTSSDDFYSNPISVPQGYRLKVELIVDDGHYIETPTWDDSKYESPQLDPNYWQVGLWNTWDGYSPNNRSYIIEGGTDHTVKMFFTRYTANEKPATFSVRAVLVDNNGNEVTGENLFSAVEIEGKVTNEGGWESLKASKPNWTISY